MRGIIWYMKKRYSGTNCAYISCFQGRRRCPKRYRVSTTFELCLAGETPNGRMRTQTFLPMMDSVHTTMYDGRRCASSRNQMASPRVWIPLQLQGEVLHTIYRGELWESHSVRGASASIQLEVPALQRLNDTLRSKALKSQNANTQKERGTSDLLLAGGLIHPCRIRPRPTTSVGACCGRFRSIVPDALNVCLYGETIRKIIVLF